MKPVIRSCVCVISLDHLVEIRMNSRSVLFQDGSSSSYFLRKLFECAAYANSLDHLDCSLGALAVFIIIFLFQEANFSDINEGSC